MARRISVRDACARFSELASSVSTTHEPVVVEQDGKPLVVLIAAEQWEAMERRREQLWATVEAIGKRNAHFDPDEVLADVTSEVEAVRQEMYEERRRADPGRR